MGSKYKYDGIPLDEYCNANGLNFETQRRRVRLYLTKNPTVSLDAATKYVINHRSRVIYKYDGKSLVDYCEEKDLAYYTIFGRIQSIKKNNPKISNDEATRIAVEEFTDSRLKYFYEGKTLDEYCEEHGLNVDTQRNRIKSYSDEHPNLPIDEVIKTVLSTCGKVFYKYEYDGKSLADYCRENELIYATMVDRVINLKKSNPSLTDDEATRIAVEEFNDRGIKYFYDGMPLVDYCRLHPEYNYISIRIYVMRKLEKNPEANVQEVIDSYFLVEHQKRTYHFVDGISLYAYCEQNGIVYNSIIKSLSKMRKMPEYSSLTEEERLKIALENYQTYVGCYLYYKGITLFSYCKENNYSYNTVYNYIFALMKEHHDITLEEAMESAFASIKRYGIKYYYKGEPLIEYCRKKGLNEKTVRNRVTNSVNKTDTTVEEAISEAISYYERKKYYDDLKKVFQYLKENSFIDEEVLRKILEFLNIDYENVMELLGCYNNLSSIVNIIWYFHDNEEDKKLSISRETFQEVVKTAKELKNVSDSKVCEIDIMLLIGIYKAGLFDTRYLILLHQENYHYSRIRAFMLGYGLKDNLDFQKELNDTLNLQLLELLERNYNNNAGMVISYINKSMNGYLSAYFIKYRKEARIISLENSIGPDSSHNRLRVIDKVALKETVTPEDEFSDGMKELLEDLESQEKLYIIYKFQTGLSDEEIATILKMSLEELNQFSRNVFLKLRNNEKIKEYLIQRTIQD